MIATSRHFIIAATIVAAMCCAVFTAAARAETPDDLYVLASNHFKHQRWELAVEEYGRMLATAPEHALAAKARFYLAEALVRAGRYDEAAAAWLRYLEATPEPALEATARFRCGEACYFAERFDDARRELLIYCDRFPASTTRPRALYYLGEMASRRGDSAEAAGCFGQLTAAYPQSELYAEAVMSNAAALRKSGDWPGAWAVLRSRYDDGLGDQNAGEVAFAAGEALDALGRDAEALAALARFRELADDKDPRRADAMLTTARIFHRTGRLVEADAAYRQLIADHPRHTSRDAVLYESAWTLKDLRRNGEAAARFAQLADERPQSALRADAAYRMAEIALAENRFDDAARAVRESLAAGAGSELKPFLHYLEGATAIAARRFDDADRSFEQLIRDYPQHELAATADFRRAEAAYLAGNWDQAEQRLERLLATDGASQQPWLAEAWLMRVRSQAQLRRWNDCIAAGAQAQRQLPQVANLFEFDLLTGRALAALAQFREAREAYRRVVEHPQARDTEAAAAAQFMIAETYFHQRDYQAALREYLRTEILHKHAAWQSAALLQAGKCQEQLGQPADARNSYEQLIVEHAASPYADEARRRRDDAVRQAAAGDNAIQRK